MKNAESIMAAFFNCRLVEKNNLFTETLFDHLYLIVYLLASEYV